VRSRPSLPARHDSQLAGEAGVERVFVESPATAAAGLLGEFDRDLGWPREVVLCLDAKWEWLRHRPDLPPFLAALIAQATLLVPPTGTDLGPPAVGLTSTPSLILS